MKLSIILPCYNEEENIKRIPIELMPTLNALNCEYEILLIDDGSGDKTVEEAQKLKIPQLKIIKHEVNRGVGIAFRTAIEKMDSDLCVFLDTDFTLHPRYINNLLERFDKGDVDFVGGSPRLAHYSKDIPLWRTMVSKCANTVYTFLFNKNVTAASQFLRLYKTRDLKELCLESAGFDISVEILFKLLSKGKRYAEIPTVLTVRQFGESKLNYKKELVKHFFLLCKICGWRFKHFMEKQ